MDLSNFFEKFDQFADAPDAVPKLRELVLELAVRGRLSERRAEDQDDPAWQAFIEEFDNRIYSYDPGPPPPFDVPDEWRWVQVDDTADACGQKKPDAAFTYIDVASIDNERGLIKPDLEVVSPENAPSRARKLVRLGTVIYATVRPYLKNIAVIDREFSPPAIISTAFAVLHPRPFVDGRFLFHWLRSKSFEAEVAECMKGVAYPAINDGDFRGCPVPLPPLAEQKRIVAKVDELMALCDRLELQQQERETRHAALARASLARFAEAPTPTNLDFLFHPSYAIPPADLRKAILDLAVYGKLEAPAPDDGELPSTEDFRVATAQFASSLGLRSPKEVLDEVEPLFDIPAHWRWTALGQLGPAQTGTTPSKNDHAAFNGEIPFIKPADILSDGIDYSNESLTRYGAESGSRLAPAGSLLMVCIGTIGKCNLIDRECAFNQQINSLSPVRWVDSRYLLIAVRAPYFQELAWAKSSSTTIAILNKGKWLSIPVPLPPLAEQRRIVAKVEQLMALVDALETQLAASHATAAKLLAALVAELTAAAPAQTPAPATRAAAPAPSHEPDFARVVLAAEIIGRLHDHDTFGQVKLQKLLHLVEYLFQLPEIDSHPLRYAAGPHDPGLIREVEQGLRVREWFAAEPRADGPGHIYRPLAGAASHREVFAQLWPEKAPRIRAFLDELRSWKTERCERFATLYAAWNDLLLWGRQPSDADIVEEVLERWDPAKKRISRDLWEDSLRWMREHGHIPTGFGRATQSAPQAELPLS